MQCTRIYLSTGTILYSSLERYLIVNFKNRQFVDLRAHKFADVLFLKYKFLPCNEDDDVTEPWVHMRAKSFH